MVSKLKLGIVGISKDNGHPYSFSAIINGYNRKSMKAAGWSGIYDYLEKKDVSDYLHGLGTITHVWTQNSKESSKIAAATHIENICDNLEDMVGQVDGVIIARDDFQNHFTMANCFLKAGMKVFVDKPLSLDLEELKFFKPYLLSGHLMSCSGLRYCRELDSARTTFNDCSDIKLVRGAVINSWEKYGIHMLDAIFGVIPFQVVSIRTSLCQHFSTTLTNADNSIIQIDAIGDSVKTFHLDFWSKSHRFSVEIEDNFTAFKRTLFHFLQMMKNGKPAINPELTINIMRVLIAANISKEENREVSINELHV